MKVAKKIFSNNYVLYSLGLIFIFVLWLIISISRGEGNLIFPTPFDTFKTLIDLLAKPYIWNGIAWTLYRTFIGFIISFVFAMILGLLAGNIPQISTFLKPLVSVLKAVPTATLVFLFLVMSGSRYAPIYIVFLISFPILYESFVGGVNSISKEINDALRIDSQKRMIAILRVKVPLAFPYVIVGLASSFALSLKSEIMAEIITGDTGYGLGCAISVYRNSDPSNMTPIFAIAVISIVFILIVDLIVLTFSLKGDEPLFRAMTELKQPLIKEACEFEFKKDKEKFIYMKPCEEGYNCGNKMKDISTCIPNYLG